MSRSSNSIRVSRINPAQQIATRDAPFEGRTGKTTGSDRRSVDPSWQTSAAGCFSEPSLFAENHEPFFNTIDPSRPFLGIFGAARQRLRAAVPAYKASMSYSSLHRRSPTASVGFQRLRLVSTSTFVGCGTGKSSGFEPLRMRPVSFRRLLAFDDMHSTGFFSWDYLFELGRNRDKYLNEYLAELAQKGLSRAPAR